MSREIQNPRVDDFMESVVDPLLCSFARACISAVEHSARTAGVPDEQITTLLRHFPDALDAALAAQDEPVIARYTGTPANQQQE